MSGCSNPQCTTPTCATYRKQITDGPFRAYTVLSARSIASVLASRDCPKTGICPYLLIDLKNDTVPSNGTISEEPERCNTEFTTVLRELPRVSSSCESRQASEVEQPNWHCPRQTKIDTKSLQQSLFNTQTMRLYYGPSNDPAFTACTGRGTVMNYSEYRDKDHINSSEPEKNALSGEEYVNSVSSSPLSHLDDKQIRELAKFGQVSDGEILDQQVDLKIMGRTDPPNIQAKGLLADNAYHETIERYYGLLTHCSRSIARVLSRPDTLLRSFLTITNVSPVVVTAYEMPKLVKSFQVLHELDFHPSNMFPSLWIAARGIYLCRRALSGLSLNFHSDATTSSTLLIDADQPTNQNGPLGDLEACHLIKIILAALIASVPSDTAIAWVKLVEIRGIGRINSVSPDTDDERLIARELVRLNMAFDDPLALNLGRRLCRAIATRFCLPEPTDARYGKGKEKEAEEFSPKERKAHSISMIMSYVTLDKFPVRIVASDYPGLSIQNGKPEVSDTSGILRGPAYWHCLLEWLRTIFLKYWDSNPWIPRCSEVAGALELMSWMCKS